MSTILRPLVLTLAAACALATTAGAAHAGSAPAAIGRSAMSSDEACWQLDDSVIYSSCTSAHVFHIPLTLGDDERNQVHRVTIAVRATSARGSHVACRVVSARETGETIESGPVVIATGAASTTLDLGTMNLGDSAFVRCSVTQNGRLALVRWERR